MKPFFVFCAGLLVGVYAEQNYTLPPIQAVVDDGIRYLQKVNERYRR